MDNCAFYVDMLYVECQSSPTRPYINSITALTAQNYRKPNLLCHEFY